MRGMERHDDREIGRWRHVAFDDGDGRDRLCEWADQWCDEPAYGWIDTWLPTPPATRAPAAYTPANATTPSTSKPPSTPSSTTPNTWPPPTTNNDAPRYSDTSSHSEGNRLQPSRPSASRHEDGSAPMESVKAAALFQSRGGCAGMPVRKSRCSVWKGIGRFQRHLFGDYPVRPGAGPITERQESFCGDFGYRNPIQVPRLPPNPITRPAGKGGNWLPDSIEEHLPSGTTLRPRAPSARTAV